MASFVWNITEIVYDIEEIREMIAAIDRDVSGWFAFGTLVGVFCIFLLWLVMKRQRQQTDDIIALMSELSGLQTKYHQLELSNERIKGKYQKLKRRIKQQSPVYSPLTDHD